MAASERLGRALSLRPGEGRPLAVMGGYLLLNTATTTVISAAKNGLFLSVFPAELIPHAVILAALLTAAIFDRDSFDRVVEHNPVVARGIYRVLTERLRNTLAQVAAG